MSEIPDIPPARLSTNPKEIEEHFSLPKTWEEAYAMGWDSDDWYDYVRQMAYDHEDY